MRIYTMICAVAVAMAPSTFGAAVYTTLVPGSSTLAANDDGSSPSTSIGFMANFFGTNHSNLFVNNNGNVTFGGALPTYTPFGLTAATSRPIIAAFFADVDTRGTSSALLTYGASTFATNDTISRNVFVANWIGVGYFNSQSNRLNNFQLLLVDRSGGDFDIVFNYDAINWETGAASGGAGGLGGFSARVGYSAGTGVAGTFSEFAGSGVNGAFLNSGPSATALILNSNVPLSDPLYTRTNGRYVFNVRNGSVSSGDVPEPSTFALAGSTLLLLAYLRKRASRFS